MLRRSGNADGIHTQDGISSSYTIVVAPPNIDRIFLHNPGTNNVFGPEDLDSDLISQCCHFHFGYPPLMGNMFENEGENLLKVFQIAKNAGTTTSCDMTLPDPTSPSGKVPWRKILTKILPFIDIFVPSVEETLYMLNPERFVQMKKEYNNAELIDYLTAEDYSDLAGQLLAMGCKVTTLKSGHRGFYVRTASKDSFDSMGFAKPADFDNWSYRELWAPAYQVEKFGSATGSGDSSIAGFLTAFLKGLTIEEALKYATCLGYQNVSVLDAVSGIKNWEITTSMINDSMPMIDINIDGHGWNYSNELKLWVGPKDSIV
jgi:sugar/nucleoside kinase (ribokinase family)